MIILKSLTIVAALLAGGSSLAIAKNGLPTGGEPPVAGGANANPVAPGFDQAPGDMLRRDPLQHRDLSTVCTTEACICTCRRIAVPMRTK